MNKVYLAGKYNYDSQYNDIPKAFSDKEQAKLYLEQMIFNEHSENCVNEGTSIKTPKLKVKWSDAGYAECNDRNFSDGESWYKIDELIIDDSIVKPDWKEQVIKDYEKFLEEYKEEEEKENQRKKKRQDKKDAKELERLAAKLKKKVV